MIICGLTMPRRSTKHSTRRRLRPRQSKSPRPRLPQQRLPHRHQQGWHSPAPPSPTRKSLGRNIRRSRKNCAKLSGLLRSQRLRSPRWKHASGTRHAALGSKKRCQHATGQRVSTTQEALDKENDRWMELSEKVEELG